MKVQFALALVASVTVLATMLYVGSQGSDNKPIPKADTIQTGSKTSTTAESQNVIILRGGSTVQSIIDINERFGQVDCLFVQCNHAYLVDYLRCRDLAADVKSCAYRDDAYVTEHLPMWTCGLTDELIDLAGTKEVALVGVTQFPPPSDAKRRRLAAEIEKKAAGQKYNQSVLTRAFGSPQQLAQRILEEPKCRTAIYLSRNDMSADKRIALEEAGLRVTDVDAASLKWP